MLTDFKSVLETVKKNFLYRNHLELNHLGRRGAENCNIV